MHASLFSSVRRPQRLVVAALRVIHDRSRWSDASVFHTSLGLHVMTSVR